MRLVIFTEIKHLESTFFDLKNCAVWQLDWIKVSQYQLECNERGFNIVCMKHAQNFHSSVVILSNMVLLQVWVELPKINPWYYVWALAIAIDACPAKLAELQLYEDSQSKKAVSAFLPFQYTDTPRILDTHCNFHCLLKMLAALHMAYSIFQNTQMCCSLYILYIIVFDFTRFRCAENRTQGHFRCVMVCTQIIWTNQQS